MKKIPIVVALSLLPLPAAAQQGPGEPPVSNARLETLAPTGGLAAAVQQARSRGGEPLWVGYAVPMVAGQGRLCCFDKDFESATCRLEGKDQGWGSRDRERRTDQRMNVLLRFADGRISRILGFSEDCPVDAGGRRFVWLGNVKPEESVAYLADLARKPRSGDDDPASEAIVSLAMHRNANADTALETLASAPSALQTREEALFWLGQMRGERGARFLAGVIQDDPNGDVREKALFSLSQSEAPWAAETILEAIEKDPDPEVRKHAVFALSQLDDGKSAARLIRLGRESSRREIRKEALFWLAQSDDPEALEYLDNVLNEN